MGNTIEQYRSAIGTYVPGSPKGRSCLQKNTKYNNFHIRHGLLSFMSIVTIILLVLSGIETIPGPQCKVVVSLDPLPSVQDITPAVTCLLRLLERGKTVVTGHNNLRYTNI